MTAAAFPRSSRRRRCKAYPPLTSPPGAYQPQPDKKNYGPYDHTFTAPGTYTITFGWRR